MDPPCGKRTPFKDITNNNRATETDEARRKREERNRRQREYRARKKAEANDPKLVTGESSQPSNMPINTAGSINSSTVIFSTPPTSTIVYHSQLKKRGREMENRADVTQEQGEKMNQKQRYYNQEFTPTTGDSCSTIVEQPLCGSDCSNICQPDKENIDPDDSSDWLHKNLNYVRRRCHPNYITCPDHTGGSLASYNAPARGGSSTKDKLLIRRERYNNMEGSKKDNLLREKRDNMREYRKRKAGCSGTPIHIPDPDGDITQKDIIHVPAVQQRISERSENDIEFDSGLYEPEHLDSDTYIGEEQGEPPHNCDIENNGDEETRW
ncbi:hypothetical protein ACP70R_048220 [Stipagrostis hirtigluma subsp. patula]